MLNLYGPISTGAAVGADGSAAANADTTTIIRGRIISVYIKYNGDKPATTDVNLKTKGTNAPTRNILTLTNKNTDGWFEPRTNPHDLLGVTLSALTYDEPVPVCDFLNLNVAQTNTDDYIQAWILIED